MNRRTLLRAVAAGVLAPLANARAPTGKLFHIGTLSLSWARDSSLGAVLGPALVTRGYVVGRDVMFEERSADGDASRLSSLAAELVALKVDIIVAGPVAAIRAARDATRTIPIVMAFSGDDPVKSGFVADLAHPGGNVTGITAQARDLAPKWMELLHDAVPGISRIAVLTNSLRPEHAEYLSAMMSRRPEGIELHDVKVRGPDEYAAAFGAMTKLRADGLIILGDVIFTRDARRLAALAMAHRLPSIFLFREFTLAGGLLSYGPDEWQLIELAADYVDKILNGSSPAQLPVHRPTRFHLAINLKSAKQLGIVIPRFIVLRADELIE